MVPTILRDSNTSEINELSEIKKDLIRLNISDKDETKVSLAIAQHYGKKTRCLDFTRDFKVALFFACNPNNSDFNKDGALIIWEKDAHKPEWFTNYVAYYAATYPDNVVSSWDFSSYIISKNDILNEFIRTGRSTDIGNVSFELQSYLGQGFMVDFEGYNADKRIKTQKGALFYFGSEYFENIDNKKIVKKSDFNTWSNSNKYYIDLHKLYNPNIDNDKYCTKIIIPQSLKKDIFDKLNIREDDLGL